MLRKILAAGTVAFALGACGGTEQTASDPGYTSASQLYCNHSTTPNSTITPAASCLTAKDLPVSGGCDSGNGTEPVDAALAFSTPVFWDSPRSAPAQWDCQWTANGRSDVGDGTPVVLDTAVANICCVAVP